MDHLFRRGGFVFAFAVFLGLASCGGGGGTPSDSADLLALTVSGGTLTPPFAPGVTAYTVSPLVLPVDVSLTATAAHADAEIAVDGLPVGSGFPSPSVALGIGPRQVVVDVSDPISGLAKSYVVTFEGTSSALVGLTCSAGALAPTFDGATTTYGVVASLSTLDSTITATSEDPLATVEIAAVPTPSGVPSAALPFAAGPTPVTVLVTARDGSTTAYTVVFERALEGQEAYIKSSFPAANAQFGGALALSGDTLVVGAPAESSNAVGVNGNPFDQSAPSSGAAYVFVRSGSTWVQQAYLKASNTSASDRFGQGVSISGDTIVVGAPQEDSSAPGVNGNEADNGAADSGAAYVFVRSGTSWTQQAYLKASNPGVNDFFGGGGGVALSGDTLVVGASFEDSAAVGVNGTQANESASGAGAAYVFVRAGTTWTQQAYLKASNTGAGDSFAGGVAVEGDTIAVGAFLEDSAATGVNGVQADENAFNSGAVYVFTRVGTAWSQQAYLKASNTGTNDFFGTVALFGDTLVVGAFFEASNATGVDGDALNNSADRSGAAYVFVRTGATWSQQAYLKASNTDGLANFGTAVAISGDTIAVGASAEDSASTGLNGNQINNLAPSAGAAYVFVRSGATWTQSTYVKASNAGTGDSLGIAVALAGDLLAVGAQGERGSVAGIDGNQADNSLQGAGAVYVFR